MNQKPEKYFIRIILISLFIPLLAFSESRKIKIDAGTDQFVNWEKTKTIRLKGSVSGEDVAIRWTCPANTKVRFHELAKPTTKVTFPRPGYYLLKLTTTGPDNKKVAILSL